MFKCRADTTFSGHPFNRSVIAPMAAAAGMILGGCSPANDPSQVAGGREVSVAEPGAPKEPSETSPAQLIIPQEAAAGHRDQIFEPVGQQEALLVMRGAVIERPPEKLDGVTERFNPDGTYVRTGSGNLTAKWFTLGNKVCLDLAGNFPDDCRYLYRTERGFALSTASAASDVPDSGYSAFSK